MKRLLIFLLAALSSVSSSNASAAVFERDWKMPGDGLLTFDDVNQREWLDLSETLLSGFPGETMELRYQSAVAEVAPGGMFEGFTVAQSADVVALAESAGIDVNSTEFSVNGHAAGELIANLGPTVGSLPDFARSVGYLDEFRPRVHIRPPPLARLAAIFNYDPPHAFLSLSTNDDALSAPPFTGVYLYRVIPEPSSVALAVVVIVGTTMTMRRFRR